MTIALDHFDSDTVEPIDSTTAALADALQATLFHIVDTPEFHNWLASTSQEVGYYGDVTIQDRAELWMLYDDGRQGVELNIDGRRFRLVIEPAG